MHLAARAALHPDKPALIFADRGTQISFRELDERSNRLAHAFRTFGLRPGDGVAAVLANEESFFDVYWAAQRSGLYFTPVNWHLSADEMRYVIDDCDAQLLVASAGFADILAKAGELPKVERRLSVGGALPGFEPIERAAAPFPATPIADECEGAA